MKRALLFLAGIGIVCYLRGRHNPKRHPLGAFKCADCATAGADMDEMGFKGGGYVPPTRKVFSREDSEVTVTSHWEPGSRGTH